MTYWAPRRQLLRISLKTTFKSKYRFCRLIHSTSALNLDKKLDFHEKLDSKNPTTDSRIITDDYQHIREYYETPKHPVMLCHGLCGFDSIEVLPVIPAFSYWHGIKEALAANSIDVYTAAVAPTASIDTRAKYLLEAILEKVPPNESDGRIHVNLVGHSMGGLDGRYIISKLIPEYSKKVHICSLTTVASPHRGSYIADLLVESSIGPDKFPALYKFMPSLGFDKNNPDGFKQLTRDFMQNHFNKEILDDPSVAYFSYGARVTPGYFNVFRKAWSQLYQVEGDNDGMVSVESAKWGEYIGTIDNVDHLDLVNFTNLVRYNWARFLGQPQPFNAIALYLHITDMLAKKGF